MKEATQYGIFLSIILILVIGGIYYQFKGTGQINNPSLVQDTGIQVPDFHIVLRNIPDSQNLTYALWNQDTNELITSFSHTGNTSENNETSRTIEYMNPDTQLILTIEEGEVIEKEGPVLLAGTFGSGLEPIWNTTEMQNATGEALLDTPTDTDALETSGIWFTTPNGDAPTLTLPSLSEPLQYSAHIVLDTAEQIFNLTIGSFKSPNEPDSFNTFSGEEPAPPFPGEDFILNAPEGLSFPYNLSTIDSTALVEINLEIANDITLPILRGEIPNEIPDHELFQLNNVYTAPRINFEEIQ